MALNNPESYFPHILSDLESARASIATSRVNTATLLTLDEDIVRLGDVAFQMKRIRNSCAPLMRLPSEILIKITEYLVVLWPSMPHNRLPLLPPQRKPSLGWVQFSHICFRLRTVLLICRHLWSSDILRIPLLPEDIYTRCRGSPLTLILQPTSPEEAVNFIVDHLSDARTIDLKILRARQHGVTSCQLQPSMFSQLTFPHLESVAIASGCIDDALPILEAGYNLPAMIAPNLRSLELIDSMIPFRPETLTSFKLSVYNVRPMPAKDFLNLLSRCTMLEILDANECMTPLPANRHTTHDQISLPYLRQLEVSGSLDMCISLLASISTPNLLTTSVYVTDAQARDLEPHQFHLATMSPYLQVAASDADGLSLCDYTLYSQTHAHDREESGNTTLTLHAAEPGSTPLRNWTGPFAHNHRTKLNLELTSSTISPPHFLQTLDATSYIMDSSHITTLNLGSSHHYTPVVWSASLSRFSNVRTLHLDYGHNLLLKALVGSDALRNDRHTITLPSLDTLWLAALTVKDDTNRGWDIVDPKEGDSVDITASQFLELFSSRRRCGSAIKCLRIEEVFFGPGLDMHDFLFKLRALVPTLQYRAKERTQTVIVQGTKRTIMHGTRDLSI